MDAGRWQVTKLQTELQLIESTLKSLAVAHKMAVELGAYPEIWIAIGQTIDMLTPHHEVVAKERWAELTVNPNEPYNERCYDKKARSWIWGRGRAEPIVSPPSAPAPKIGEKVYTREYVNRKWNFTEVDSWRRPVEWTRLRDKESERLGGWRWLYTGWEAI